MGAEGARHLGEALQNNTVKIRSMASFLSNLVFALSLDTHTT